MTRAQRVTVLGVVIVAGCSGDGGPGPQPVDIEPPTVSLTADRSLLTTPGNVVLSAIATGSSGVHWVVFHEQRMGVDTNPILIALDSFPPYQHVRHFQSAASDGTYEFSAKAYDRSGNVGSSLRASVVVAMASNDHTPPTVTGTTPNEGAAGVPVDATISATFSEPLHPQSITSASFTLRPGVTGTVTYAGTTAAFTPATPLALGTTYTATISTAVRDIAGNALASPYIWTFSTRSTTSATFEQIYPGFFYVCAVKTGGDAVCWGQNDASQLGDGTATVRLTPVGVQGGLSFTSVTAARQGYHTCGVTTGGAAYCWGLNANGQLGDGTTTLRRTPVSVVGGITFTSIGTGRSHSCGLAVDSTAYCWGDNFTGQLGDGTTTERRTPVAVQGGHLFETISVGGYHNCGRAKTGVTYCWGSNGSGELGDGTTTDRTSPVAVSGGHQFARVSAGAGLSCGVTSLGRAYCWGDNFFGALGNGTTSTTPQTTPVAVVGGHTFLSVSAGVSHVCATTSDDRGYCWGSNYAGQLGDGTTERRTAPVAVVGNLTFRTVRVGDGGGCSCGVTVTGVAYCWGDNLLGQLGNGTTNESPVPVKVAGQP